MSTTEPEIRTLALPEVEAVVAWAAGEGWNPGLHDARAFFAADLGGFLGAFVDGELAGAVSAVRYGAGLGFIGLFIVQPEYRRHLLGVRLGRAALGLLDGRCIGTDGVPAQQHQYERLGGFRTVWRNVRYRGAIEPAGGAVGAAGADGAASAGAGPAGGHVSGPASGPAGGPASGPAVAGGPVSSVVAGEPVRPAGTGSPVVPASAVSFEALAEYDADHFGARRDAFLRPWLSLPGHEALVWAEKGPKGSGTTIRGLGVIRRCRQGHKVGPLFADTAEIADALFVRLTSGRGDVTLDTPEANPAAVALAQRYGLASVFETARMYRGGDPGLPADRIFGITSFELG